jgi:hypothetical protein
MKFTGKEVLKVVKKVRKKFYRKDLELYSFQDVSDVIFAVKETTKGKNDWEILVEIYNLIMAELKEYFVLYYHEICKILRKYLIGFTLKGED